MKKYSTVVAVASLMSAPAAASVRDAAFASSAEHSRTQNSMFIGLNYGVALNRKADGESARPSFTVARMVTTSSAQFRVGQGVGLTTGAKGGAVLLVGGQKVEIKNGRANLSKGGTIAIVAVGVLAAGAVAAYYALRDPCDYKECE